MQLFSYYDTLLKFNSKSSLSLFELTLKVNPELFTSTFASSKIEQPLDTNRGKFKYT